MLDIILLSHLIPSEFERPKVPLMKSPYRFSTSIYYLETFCEAVFRIKASACNFTESNTLPWVFFTFLKLCKWYQIAHSSTYRKLLSCTRQVLNVAKRVTLKNYNYGIFHKENGRTRKGSFYDDILIFGFLFE